MEEVAGGAGSVRHLVRRSLLRSSGWKPWSSVSRTVLRASPRGSTARRRSRPGRRPIGFAR
eukprot:9973416-Lingulodinium_polyedra.AAC.1